MRSGGILGIGLATLLRAVSAGAIRRRLRRFVVMAILAGLAGIALLAGAGAAIAALWLWLAAEQGPVHAALIMAAAIVTFGLVMLLILWGVARRPRRSGAARDLLQWLKAQSKEHQGELVLAAVLAGLVAALAGSKSSRSKPDDA